MEAAEKRKKLEKEAEEKLEEKYGKFERVKKCDMV